MLQLRIASVILNRQLLSLESTSRQIICCNGEPDISQEYHHLICIIIHQLIFLYSSKPDHMAWVLSAFLDCGTIRTVSTTEYDTPAATVKKDLAPLLYNDRPIKSLRLPDSPRGQNHQVHTTPVRSLFSCFDNTNRQSTKGCTLDKGVHNRRHLALQGEVSENVAIDGDTSGSCGTQLPDHFDPVSHHSSTKNKSVC